jgi:ubiquinone/menaquinone biosynthesis C-methylase UbiE
MMNHQERVSSTIELGAKTGYYGSLATSYDDSRFGGPLGPLKNWLDQRLVRRAVKHAGNIQRVLDVPCGTGRLVRSLVHGIPQLVGADVSRDMIDLSRRHGTFKGRSAGHLEYVQCDAQYLPFHNDSFDLVVSGRFLHHLFRVPQAARIQVMREFARVSRRWVLGDFNIQYGLKYYLNRVRTVLKGKHFKSRRMTKDEVFRELSQIGLRVEKAYPLSWIASEKWYILCRK